MDLPFEEVLVIDFTDAALRMTIKGMEPFTNSGASATFIDPDLGFEDSQSFFAKVEAQMRRFVQAYRSEITMILLTGTRANDERFKQALRDALADLVSLQAMLRNLFHDHAEPMHVFATARGAAEVAKRRLEGPVRCTWRNCKIPGVETLTDSTEDIMEL